MVDIDPDVDGLSNASLSFDQFDVIIPKQRLGKARMKISLLWLLNASLKAIKSEL